VSGAPVLYYPNSVTSQNIYYAPYVHDYITIFDGTQFAAHNFLSGPTDNVGLTLAMGGNAVWPSGQMYDLFATLVAGAPTLCSVKWTNTTTRAVGLVRQGGLSVNNAATTAYTSGGVAITLPQYQGTFLGSFLLTGNGSATFASFASASGFGLVQMPISNVQNRLRMTMRNINSAAPYTYASTTVRQAMGAANAAIGFCSFSSEPQHSFAYNTSGKVSNGAFSSWAQTGIGINALNFYSFNFYQNPVAQQMIWASSTTAQFSGGGYCLAYALEATDGNSHTFNWNQYDTLWGQVEY
jgi:hypothetical protein